MIEGIWSKDRNVVIFLSESCQDFSDSILQRSGKEARGVDSIYGREKCVEEGAASAHDEANIIEACGALVCRRRPGREVCADVTERPESIESWIFGA